jgi:hypothetical protein
MADQKRPGGPFYIPLEEMLKELQARIIDK